MRRMSTTCERRRPRCSCPWVASRRFSWATTLCTAARSCEGSLGSARSNSCERLCGRQRLGALDQRALELASQHPLELAQPLLRRTVVRVGKLAAGLAAQAQRTPDALHVHSDHAGALSLAAERRDREAGEVPHLAVRTSADGLGGCARAGRRGPCARRPRSARRSGRAGPPRAPPRGRRSGRRASSNTRRSSCDFASVAASASRKSSSSVQLSSRSAWNASSSSEVPTAMPSRRSSSANSSRRAAKPGGPGSGRPP